MGVHSRDQEYNGLTSLGFWYGENAKKRTPSFDWAAKVLTLRTKITGSATPKTSTSLLANSNSNTCSLLSTSITFEEEVDDDEDDDDDNSGDEGP